MNTNRADQIMLIIFVILLPILLLLLSYKLALVFTPLDDNQKLVVDYLRDTEQLEFLNLTQPSPETPAITNDEVSHLNDVSKLMNKLEYFFLLSLIICSLLFTQHRKNKHIRDKMLLYGGIVTLAATVILILAIIISFNESFTIFHNILFPQGNWLFAEESFLITTFPLSFFISITTKILLINIGLSLFFIAYHTLQKHLSKRSMKSTKK